MLNLINLPKSIKVKVGLFFGYNGHKYQGMQYQRPSSHTITPCTIQNTIHNALCENGFVLKSNMCHLKRIKWSRACRTDKRVHALCNGIAASLQFDQRYVTNWQNRAVDLQRFSVYLNSILPNDIRIFAMRRLGKAFDMRHQPCSRIYQYICPLKLFRSRKDLETNKKISSTEESQIVFNLQNMLKLFLGTHSFHNFTKGYKIDDPRCMRYIKQISVQRVQHQDNSAQSKEQFLRFTIVGQSFIFNQIRKMIGLLIKIYYEELQTEEAFNRAFAKQRYDIYLAPGEGLYLNRMTFTSYNSKKQEKHLRIILTTQQQNKIRQFKEQIQQKIFQAELTDKVFSKWLAMHTQEDSTEPAQLQEQSDQD